MFRLFFSLKIGIRRNTFRFVVKIIVQTFAKSKRILKSFQKLKITLFWTSKFFNSKIKLFTKVNREKPDKNQGNDSDLRG